MTPTDEIRARLDEFGIEHYDHENGEPLRDLSEEGADPATSWRMDGASVCAVPNNQGTFDLWIDNCTPEQAIAATLGRSCASCTEMDNPDSYISHLQSALEWHDEHVPKPTNPRNTCVVLKGKNKPDEVLFIHDEGGVTHYLPEDAGTCKDLGGIGADNEVVFNCSECGCVLSVFDKDGKNNLCTSFIYDYPRFCPECGRRIKEHDE